MKDLTFKSQSGSLSVTYRTDLISSDANNFSVFTITGIDEQNPTTDPTKLGRELAIIKAFQKLSYTLEDFIAFAEDWGLQLIAADSNGSNSVELVAHSNSDNFS